MSFVSRHLKEVQPPSKPSHSSPAEDVAKKVITDQSAKTKDESHEKAPGATGGAPIEASVFWPTSSEYIGVHSRPRPAMPQ